MKLTRLSLLIAAALVTASAQPLDLPTNTSLGDNLPDDSFSITRTIEKNLLPVEPALLNILHFMGVVAIQNPDEELPPRRYSAPSYRQVQITSYAHTKARYLLWGIYMTVIEMISTSRFHDSVVNLFFEGNFVGRMKIEVKTVLTLPTSGDVDPENRLTQFNRTVNLEGATDAPAAVFSNGTTEVDFLNDSQDLWNSTAIVQSTTTAPSNASVSVGTFNVVFKSVSGAQHLSRNDIFLTFYTAILHLALVSPGKHLTSFEARSPNKDIYIRMFGPGMACLVSSSHSIRRWLCLVEISWKNEDLDETLTLIQNGRAIGILTYIPKFMAQHPDFGYVETQFYGRSGEYKTCEGGIVKSLNELASIGS